VAWTPEDVLHEHRIAVQQESVYPASHVSPIRHFHVQRGHLATDPHDAVPVLAPTVFDQLRTLLSRDVMRRYVDGVSNCSNASAIFRRTSAAHRKPVEIPSVFAWFRTTTLDLANWASSGKMPRNQGSFGPKANAAEAPVNRFVVGSSPTRGADTMGADQTLPTS
jgi:hypothetical protein